MLRAVVEVAGCCNRYRAQLVVKPGTDLVITLEAFGVTANSAYARLMNLSDSLSIEGLDPRSIEPRRWPEREKRAALQAERPSAAPTSPESEPAIPLGAATPESATEHEAASGDGEGDDDVEQGGDKDL